MQQKNIFLMLTLSLSVLMMMTVSMLFSLPTRAHLEADIRGVVYKPTSMQSVQPDIAEVLLLSLKDEHPKKNQVLASFSGK